MGLLAAAATTATVPSEHDYADALRKTLLFFRAQRSGDLAGTENPIPWRRLPAFLEDGSDVGVDLSKGYFDAGDYVKYGQPAAYAMSILAWGGLEFAPAFSASGALEELKAAVRWGTDYMLKAASNIGHQCTYYAQVGRGAAENCMAAECKYDHGYWGRPEEYASYEFSHLRRTYAVDARAAGVEVWASASAALAGVLHLLTAVCTL